MGLFSGIGKALGGIGKVFSGLGQVAKALGGIMNSPLGGLLKMAFPPLGLASGFLNFAGMMGNLAGGIGGGQNY
ncbi:hypothetical protein [Paracoccus jiaweipingae]|uniref:hypothetical protein n=1 Tax=unclassified Paracoccus (in: a-proteobacteria) TaxID=2688777 RepID=UPI00379ADD99